MIMAKNNYSKVEEALAEGLRKMKVNELLEISDKNTKAPAESKEEVPGTALISKTDPESQEKQLLKAVQINLNYLKKAGLEPYKRLKLNKEELAQFLKNPEKMSDADKIKMKKLKEQLDLLKSELKDKPQSSDEELIKKETKAQKQKRFNIRDNWLPLK